MEQLTVFYGNHILLVSSFIAVTGILIWQYVGDAGNKNAVDVLTATDLINHQNAVIIDVRSSAEYKQGHIINAINVPLNGLKNQLKPLEKHKAKPVVVSCRSGSRSALACRLLSAAGFENVHNLRGGMLAWENASMPIRKKS